MKKVILRLCTDVGSDSRVDVVDNAYGVVLVGSDINIPELVYTRPNRHKPSIASMHRSAIDFSQEYAWYWDKVRTGYDFRGLCSVGFSSQLKEQIAEEML